MIFCLLKTDHPVARGAGPSQWCLEVCGAPGRHKSSDPLEKFLPLSFCKQIINWITSMNLDRKMLVSRRSKSRGCYNKGPSPPLLYPCQYLAVRTASSVLSRGKIIKFCGVEFPQGAQTSRPLTHLPFVFPISRIWARREKADCGSFSYVILL